jgi:hypothetical protein
MINNAKTLRNKENKTDESLISQSSRPEQEPHSSRFPVKVLPTYIFSLKPPQNPLKLEKTPSKKSLSRVQSSSKMLNRKSSLKSEKSLKSLKSLKSKTPLNPSNTDSLEKHSKSFKKPSQKSKEKKTLKSRTPLKSNINLNILIKAINDHCASCCKFKEELRKKNIELS